MGLGEKDEGIGQRKKTQRPRQRCGDSQGKKGVGGGRRGYRGINSDGRGVEHTIHYTDHVLQNCTPETHIILLTNVTPINSVKKKSAQECREVT